MIEKLLNVTANVTSIAIANSQSYMSEVTYGFVQACQVLSFIAYFVVGYYFLSSPKELKNNLAFHVIFLILVVDFIALSFPVTMGIDFFHTGHVRPPTFTTCIVLTYIDSITYYASLFLMAWATFERHLLIFHSKVYNTKRGRILFHYLPITIIFAYIILYYFAVDFLYPCENKFDYSQFYCGFICYMNLPTPTLLGIEMMAHQVLPTILIALFSFALFLRAIYARKRLRQSVDWRKYQRMIIQLLSTSIVYLIFTTPFSLVPIAQAAGLPPIFTYDVYQNFLTYWTFGVPMMVPFVIALSLPKMKEKIKSLFTTCCSGRVGPST